MKEGKNMIKLSDISIDNVLYGSEQRFVNLAKENNCYSVEDLISLTKEYPKYDWDIVNKRIDELKLIVDKSSIKGIKPETYEYEDNGIESVDKLNKVFIPFPAIELQNQFASFVEEIDKSRLLSNHLLFLLKSITF